MAITKITISAILAIVIIFLVTVTAFLITQEKIIVYGCSPDFWKNNLET